jgi:hypothetical protein
MWVKWWLAGTVLTLQLISTSEEAEHSVLCRSCGREVADPGLLYTRVLSPEFLERRNLSRLFGSRQPVSVERLRNPAGREFQIVSFTKAGNFKLCLYCTGNSVLFSFLSTWIPRIKKQYAVFLLRN